jgi:hypothetical protein
MTCLDIRDVTALLPYRNLVLRFRGEENPMLRIGIGTSIEETKIKIVGVKGSLGLHVAYPSADKPHK